MKFNCYKRFISILLVFILMASLVPISANAGNIDSLEMSEEVQSISWEDKIDEHLWDKMEYSDNDDKISVWIWFSDIDQKEVDKQVEKSTGLTTDNLAITYNSVPDDLVKALEDASEKTDNDAQLKLTADKLKAYIDSTTTQRKLEQQRTNTYIKAHRNASRDLYVEKNGSIIKELNLPEDEIIFQSQLTPSAIVNLTKNQILDVAKSDEVISVDFYDDSQQIAPMCENQKLSMRTDIVQEQFGLTGEGVNVLMNDYGCVRSDVSYYETISNPDNINLIYNKKFYTPTEPSDIPKNTANYHANLVAATMQAFSPDVNIYSIGYACYTDIEWALLNCDIDLINGSINYGTFTNYTSNPPAKWFDALVSAYNITLIASAGNSESWQDDGWPHVISPSSGYNSIAVSAYSAKGNPDNDRMFNYRYNPTTGSDWVCYKPDMVIAANSTSEASPSLSGIVSMLIQLKPSLASNPELIKAILMASCHRKVKPAAGTGEQEEMTAGLTQRQGSGAVDAYRALSIVLQERYGLGEITSGSIDPASMRIEEGNNVNVSLAWLRQNTNNSDSPSGGTILGTLQELELSVYCGSDLIGTSAKANTGKQMVYFPSSALSNQYKIRVTKLSQNDEPVRYAYAWSTEDNYITLHTNNNGELTREEVQTQLKEAGIIINQSDIPFSVAFDESVTSIGDSAFEDYSNLANVILRNGIMLIGKNAFRNCSSLKSIKIPDTVLIIEESAFEMCTHLENAIIGNSVRNIDDYAFLNCISLSKVDFLRDIAPTISTGAFSGVAKGATGHPIAGAIGYKDSYDDLQIIYEEDMRTLYFTNNGNWSNLRAYMWKGTTSWYDDVPMEFAYNNYLGQQIYSVTFNYLKYNNIRIYGDNGEGQTVNISNVSDGTGYYITSKDSYGNWNVSTYKPDVRTIYFANNGNWSDVRAYLWKSGTQISNIWHGAPMKYVYTDSNGIKVYSITFDYKEFDYVVFNDAASDQQTVDISIGADGTVYYLVGVKRGNGWLVGSYI